MVGTDRDDELARTATAPVGSTATQPAAPADPVGSTLGRYKLERELGSGGMGVVHAAFDPDLERRVALKVLREAAGSTEARRRLLNEARAMARLQHPNVVTVHEVSSAGGRDYVAMELIEGQTLAEWMRAERRPESELIAAFVAAGRGLAAAHAEGIVHRDFKPHNILRHRSGRIAVTDFGLARDSEAVASIDPLAETRELRAPAGTAVSTSTPSSPIGGDTVTGSVLGTPAYMAPEQWSGGAVTPATDQFGFCVALWEALAGERPFKGPTVERLREEVASGPARLDISKIPRRLRPALLRGLDPDPARRWPSMDALLAAMTGAQNRSKATYVVTGSAIAAGAMVLVAIKLAGGAEPVAAAPECRAPLRTVDDVWRAGSADGLARGGQGIAAAMLDADARAWTAARDKACSVDAGRREPQLACLDGVLARLDVVARGVEALAGSGRPDSRTLVGTAAVRDGERRDVDVGAYLVDPAVCAMETPPRLVATTTPQMRATMAAVLLHAAVPGRPSAAAVKQAIETANGDPCASVYARFLAIQAGSVEEREQHLAQAAEEGERCSDDRVRAETALLNAELALESSSLGTAITSKVKLAELAAQRVMQHDVLGNLEAMRSEIARRAEQLDEAIVRAEAAAQHYAKRGRVAAELAMRHKLFDLHQTRATPQDLANLATNYEALAKRAAAQLGAAHDVARDIERTAADWQYRNGDFETAMRRFEAVYKPSLNEPARHIKGRVVDERGRPVAGARVAAGKRMGGTPTHAASPWSDSVRFTTSGADGTFEIPDAVEFGTIVAQRGEQRSMPVLIGDDITLKLAPTSTVSGRVDLHGEPYQLVTVVAVDPDQPDMRYGWPSPVAADGTFQLGGVPRKRLKVFAAISRTTTRQAGYVAIDVVGPKLEGVKLEVMKSQRTVHVVVRSTVGIPVGNAAVIVTPGKLPSMSARQMRQTMSGINEKAARQIEGERAPAPVVKLARPGDLFATMTEVPDSPASACAIALPQDLADPQLGKKIDANLDKLKIECAPIPDGAEAVVIEVPPFPRLD